MQIQKILKIRGLSPGRLGVTFIKNTSWYQTSTVRWGSPALNSYGLFWLLILSGNREGGSHKARGRWSPFTYWLSEKEAASSLLTIKNETPCFHFPLLPPASSYWDNTPEQKILTCHCAWCLGQLHRARTRVSGRGSALGKPFPRLAMEPDPQTESLQTQNPHYSPFHSPPLWGTIEEIKNDLLGSLISRYKARLNINQPALHKILASCCKSSKCLFQFQMRMETEHELL